jgi:hypothetical protein
MLLNVAKELQILKAPYGTLQKDKYSHKRRFRMLVDIEDRLRNNTIQLQEADLGHLLDERDRFQMHYLWHLSKRDYFRLLTMFDFIDDEKYIHLMHLFHEQLNPTSNAYVCPNCKVLSLHAGKIPFPCRNCNFTPNKYQKTFVHCEFRFARNIMGKRSSAR